MKNCTCVWNIPCSPLPLPDDEVHVWWASLETTALLEKTLAQTLSADEQARAAKFHFDKDRKHFVVARGLLRMLLGQYLGIKANQIEFSYGSQGKPALAPCDREPTLSFNLSHSQDHVLYAFTQNRQIGIDLEYIRRLPDIETIVEHFFSAREHSVFQTLSPSQKIIAFFSTWTCKEAVLKAIGEGLAQPMDQIEVSLDLSESVRLLSIEDDPKLSAQWSLYRLQPVPDYSATLAVRGQGWHLKCWQFTE
ncbi:MAG: 4'-phosphopantetheinyl transferase superfamily protein [Aphanocapsa sp. GSE-SYN-MK-11-07L]|jgi:4'-phosphopantetheinyl transferase|nr:4'-phosphopantetheinyl transferase superfamily protein [Aphanocapsa sp. GSE-SYN-MK-11-07L]